MRSLVIAACFISVAAFGAATTNDIRKYQQAEDRAFEYGEGAEHEVHEILMKARDGAGAARELAAEWRISAAAALASVEIVIRENAVIAAALEQPGERHTLPPDAAIDALYDRALAAARDASRIWEMLLGYRALTGRCDASVRDAYFAKSFAASYVRVQACENWLPAYVSRFSRDLGGHDALVRYLTEHSRADALAANLGMLAELAPARDRAPDDVALYVLRRQFTLLNGGDLGAELLAFVDALPPAWRTPFFERPLDGKLDARGREISVSVLTTVPVDEIRIAWLVTLIEAGRTADARAALEGFKLPRGVGKVTDRKPRESQVFDDDGADAAEFVRDLLGPAAGTDFFERYVGDGKVGLLWGPATHSFPASRLVTKLMRAHGLESVARFLETPDCRYAASEPDSPAPGADDLRALPASHTGERERFAQLLAARPASPCASRGEDAGPAPSSRLTTYPEIPLTAAQKKARRVSNFKGELPLPKGFDLVRAEKSGQLIAALCQSSAADPAGEVTGGGYWLLLSRDDGRNFGDPLYLGFQRLHPYELLPDVRVPLLAGDTLQVEVRVRELAPESITFPPVDLRTRRSVDDVYIEIPLAALERDADRDGLTDLLEQRLSTDPAVADTDGDGIVDGEDDIPHVSAQASPHALGALVVDLLGRIAGFNRAALIEPLSADRATADSMPQGVTRGDDAWYFAFILGDPAYFTGLRLNGPQAIVLDRARLHELGARFGPTYPLNFPVILVDEKGDRAVVEWDAGWTGGKLRFDRVDGKWTAREVEGWIT